MGNIRRDDGNKCPICKMLGANISANSVNEAFYYYECKNCGRFFAPNPHIILHGENQKNVFDFDFEHLRVYLFYHKCDYRPVICSQEYYNTHITDEYLYTYNLTPETVENWYPKTFADKINLALLYLDELTNFPGERITIAIEDLQHLFFMSNSFDNNTNSEWKDEIIYILSFLQDNEYIQFVNEKQFLHSSGIAQYMRNLAPYQYKSIEIFLTVKAMNIIYDLQKAQSNNKNAFIAMKFGDETKELREAIKKAIIDAGYIPRIMDEIEHNHQIVPEMLYEIRNSRFMVAELSYYNNGAYYEAGYGLGIGKEVIHICSNSALENDLHFDVAQVNTVVYNNYEELTRKLTQRIRVTIQ